MMDPQREACVRQFQRFKPVCDNLAKHQSRQNVLDLLKMLSESANDEGLQELQEYILFPLKVILKQPKKLSEEIYTDVCTCIAQVFSLTKVTRWETCRDIFSTLSILISSSSNLGSVSECSEELKIAVIKALDLLLKSTEFSIVENLYKLENIPMLGHVISLLLDVIEREKARQLRLQALQCLLSLLQKHHKLSRSAQRLLGDTFASFLPGMSMGLCKVITTDEKQGQLVTTTALEVWSHLVVLVMGDNSQPVESEKKKKPADDEMSKLTQLKVNRTSDWIKTTSGNLLILVKQIADVRTHSSWKVRAALVDLASQILSKCTRNMQNCMPVLLEIMVGLIGDDFDGVSLKARKSLESFSQSQIQGESERPLVEILEDSLYSLATSLPRQIRTADDKEKISVLNVLIGYMELLGPNTISLLRSFSHLKRLSTALIQVLEFDCTDIKITEDISHITEHGASALEATHSNMIQRPRKYFKHFSDEKITEKFNQVCHLLGYYGDTEILVDHFLDVYHDSKMYRLSATYIINEIIIGTVRKPVNANHQEIQAIKDRRAMEPLIRILIDEYLSPSNFNLQTSYVDDTSTGQSSRTGHQQLTLTSQKNQPIISLNSNVLQICLFLEGFGKFAEVLGSDFSPLLIKVLYPLMEKLGDDKAFISTTAYLSLMDICTHCKYSSLDKLLQANSDYVVNSISVRLRHLRQNPRAPLVLKVVLQYSSAELLPLVQDTIQEVLTTLDQYHDEKAVMFMKVLHSLVLAVEKWYPSAQISSPKHGAMEKTITTADEVVEFMREYHRTKLISEGDINLDEAEDESPHGEDEITEDEDKPVEHPTHINTVKEVWLRSKHLLSSHNPRLRLLVLDTITHASTVLSDHEDVLLPLVHQIWSPFVDRFHDEEKLVTVKAFQTLISLANVAGDFMRKRTVTSIFPKLIRFLQDQSHISMKVGPAYKFTAPYKLQAAILSGIGKLCCLLGVESSDLECVILPSSLYLSSRQPIELQKAALGIFTKLIDTEPDLIWLLLIQLYNPLNLPPPNEEFPSIKTAEWTRKRNEFSDNVTVLLESF